MRHKKKGKKLSRNHNQKKALFLGLVRSLFLHGSIKTTMPKAKAVLPLVDRLARKAQKGDLSSRRFLYRYLQDRRWVNRVVSRIAQTFGDRPGNYVKITPLKYRSGDRALIARLEFAKTVDFHPPRPSSQEKEPRAPKIIRSKTPKNIKKNKKQK